MISKIKQAYGDFYTKVENLADSEGWVYTREAPFMLDVHFENAGGEIEFQKSFGISGDNPHWLTIGSGGR